MKHFVLFVLCLLIISECHVPQKVIQNVLHYKHLSSENALMDGGMCSNPVGGGESCVTNSDCNFPNGTCINDSCVCEWESGWTGPDCTCNDQITCMGRGECDPGTGDCICTFPYHGQGCEYFCEAIWDQPQIQPHNETHYGYGIETFVSDDLLYSFTAAIDFQVNPSYLQIGVIDFWGSVIELDPNVTAWEGKYYPPELIEWFLWQMDETVQWPNGVIISFYTHASDEIDHPGTLIYSSICDPFEFEYWDSVQSGTYEELGYTYPTYEHIIKFRCFLTPFFEGQILISDPESLENGEITYWMSMQAYYETGNVPENYTWGWTLQPLTMNLSASVVKYTTTIMQLGDLLPNTWYELLFRSEHPMEGDPADLSTVIYNCTPISEICDRDYCSEHGEGDWIEQTETCECACDSGYDGPICQCGDLEDCNDNGTVSWNDSQLHCDCLCDSGHSGPNCQCSDVDDCSDHGTSVWAEPCTCICDEGWIGEDCSIPSWCIDDLCNEHGTVTWNATSGECPCTCDEDWDEATANCSIPDSCQNHTFCNSNGNATWNSTTEVCTCECVHGMVGEQCDTEAQCLDDEWCNEHGSAELVDEECVCFCFFGWSGEWCDVWEGFDETGDLVIIVLLSILTGLLVIAFMYCHILIAKEDATVAKKQKLK